MKLGNPIDGELLKCHCDMAGDMSKNIWESYSDRVFDKIRSEIYIPLIRSIVQL